MARATQDSFPYENCRINDKRETTHQIMHIRGQPHSSPLKKSTFRNQFLYKHDLVLLIPDYELGEDGKNFPTL